MGTLQKINSLNRFLKHTMVITSSAIGGGQWTISSFGDGTLFSAHGDHYARYGYPTGATFAQAVDYAYQRMVVHLQVEGAIKQDQPLSKQRSVLVRDLVRG